MLSAKDMRQYQQKVCNDIAEQELSEIEATIKSAILNNRYQISVSKHYSRMTVKKLIEMGYGVHEEDSQMEGAWTTISWKDRGCDICESE